MINTYNAHEIISSYQPIDEVKVQSNWNAVRSTFTHKIVVLDDDPTGVQTVHDVSVYTDWDEDTIEQGFREEGQIFFILTNSRALTSKETEKVHQDIAQRVEKISTKLGKPYLIISRGDSTLRGHYPLETEVLRSTIEENSLVKVDGEVILPFFKEGGRLTIENTHLVLQEDVLVPAGETEFARDRTFGYTSSHLGEWIEEKTKGGYSRDSVTYISLETIRRMDYDQIMDQLLKVHQFDKVVVNAVEEADVRIFATALIQAIQKGKRFIFRTAATFTKVIGDISSRPLLTKEELISDGQQLGGLVIVGSHVQKTTDQLNELKTVASLYFIEFNAHLVLNKAAFEQEINRVRLEAERKIKAGVTPSFIQHESSLSLVKEWKNKN